MRIKKEMDRLLPTQILRILKQKGGIKICGALERSLPSSSPHAVSTALRCLCLTNFYTARWSYLTSILSCALTPRRLRFCHCWKKAQCLRSKEVYLSFSIFIITHFNEKVKSFLKIFFLS
jgi:hypothetical protein